MSNPLKPPIRPTRRDLPKEPTGGTQSMFHGLPCEDELYKKLAGSVPLSEVARWLQDDEEQLKDRSRETLVRALYRYREKIPLDRRTELTPSVMATTFHKERRRQAALVEGINEIVELQRLYDLQMDRIFIDVENEERTKKLLGSTSNDVRLAMDMLNKSAELKIKLGLLRPIPPEIPPPQNQQTEEQAASAVTVSVRYETAPTVGKVAANGESRRKVLGAANRLFSLLGSGALPSDVASLLRSDTEAADLAASVGTVIEGTGEIAGDADPDFPIPEEGSYPVDDEPESVGVPGDEEGPL